MEYIFFCWVFVCLISGGVEMKVAGGKHGGVRRRNASSSSSSSSLKSVGGVTVFRVTDYGAVGDGLSDDKKAFMAAWSAACSVESATILLPSHHIFSISPSSFSGPCLPDLLFQVDGVLMAPDGPEKWPKSESPNRWIVFNQVHNMTLKGKGFVEGNGRKWWDLPCKPHRSDDESSVASGPCNSPTLIRFSMSSNLVIKELRVQNSPEFHINLDNCEHVYIHNISISSPKLSPNTDGIHMGNTRYVKIHNSTISNGDDCISVGPGCSAVEIDGVTCGPGHGISIGSLGVEQSRACVSDMVVRNVRIKDSDNGLRIKTWQGGSGAVSNITFENIHMEGVTNCMVIDQYYCMSKTCRNQTSAVRVKNVSYRNIKGTYDVRTTPIHFACSDTVPCSNITLIGVQLLPDVGGLVDDPFCWNVYGSEEMPNIPPLNCLKMGLPQMLDETPTLDC